MGNLQRFVERGGVLITLGNGSALALEGGLVRGVSHASGGGSGWTPGVVVSGGATGEDVLEERPAILGIPVVKGHVVAYHFDAVHRGLNRAG